MARKPASARHVPRYREIAEAIREEIRRGRHPVGSRLPTEAELTQRFDTSRPTIRAALTALAQAGLIVRRTRVGSTVVATEPASVLAQQVGSIEELLDYPANTHRRPVAQQYIRADHELASLLRCPPGTDWLRLSMLRYSGDSPTPLCWTDIYVTPRYADVTRHPRHDLIPVCVQITELFDEVIEQADVEVFAGRIPKAMAKPLKAPADSPALYVVRRYHGRDGQVFETSVSVHPEQRYRYAFQLRRELRPNKRG